MKKVSCILFECRKELKCVEKRSEEFVCELSRGKMQGGAAKDAAKVISLTVHLKERSQGVKGGYRLCSSSSSSSSNL